MTSAELAFWAGVMLVGFAGSALFSGMETGCYCLNRVRLHVRATHGERSAKELENMVGNPTTLLSTLLIGNNITNYMGTAGLAVILNASGLSDGQQMLANTLIVTPVLFVVGETLPKDLFSAHADKLMYRLWAVLKAAKIFFTVTLLVPIVWLFSVTLMACMGQRGSAPMFHARRRVGDLVKEGMGLGLLSDAQSEMVERVLSTGATPVSEQMTPWRRVRKLSAGDDLSAVAAHAAQSPASCLPVVDRQGVVVGAVDVLEALAADPTAGIKDVMRSPLEIAAQTPLRHALGAMRQAGEHWALVIDKAGRPVGVASSRDVLEPITGALPR